MASPTKLTVTPLLFIITLISISISPASAKTFRCTSGGATCDAVVDYVSPNRTTLGAIQSLFTVPHLRSILGANNFTLNSTGRTPVEAKQTVRIPFPCICRNGTGVSNGRPVYTVVSGDGLYHIAADVFSNIVTVAEIVAANNIENPDVILVGQNLTIPMPCSCDAVDGAAVVHYGHEVAAGSSIEGIAQQYNVSQETLMQLNNLTGPQDLKAEDIIDVPLRACSSMVTNSSLDYPLLVPSNAYVVTANTCVKCKCNTAMNTMLQCEPAGINSSCPLIPCEGSANFLLGNTTTSGCNATTCSYAGYNRTIQTMVDTVSTCPAPPSPGSSATSLWQGWRWNGLMIFMLCVLLV
ncbi:lysM domain-containing GPI-anchored protein 2 [Salvia miltiorrhiza]|uniref:lysM domain-containing GPI-anchored protein 2 n=1 Tax=Salvia miltiorrhiza TaxID=226208 RepID=UPI0025AD103A|nr:lysM domain-containing GPI-anchored protein 2 [Salvia miltiorrhiza]